MSRSNKYMRHPYAHIGTSEDDGYDYFDSDCEGGVSSKSKGGRPHVDAGVLLSDGCQRRRRRAVRDGDDTQKHEYQSLDSEELSLGDAADNCAGQALDEGDELGGSGVDAIQLDGGVGHAVAVGRFEHDDEGYDEEGSGGGGGDGIGKTRPLETWTAGNVSKMGVNRGSAYSTLCSAAAMSRRSSVPRRTGSECAKPLVKL